MIISITDEVMIAIFLCIGCSCLMHGLVEIIKHLND